MSDIALQLDVLEPRRRTRPRSDSQSHHAPLELPKRTPAVYFVTLSPLNDTFVKKHLLVPYYPETRKLGRPAGAKIKPDATNGYFDLRVLSRSHAAMYMDQDGRLMLKDLGLSNGTYVNDERIDSEPVEIHIGDSIYLGFNIQADTNHKQISARVDNISVMSNFLSSSVPEVGQYNYIQSILDKLRDNSDADPTTDLPLFADMAGLDTVVHADTEHPALYKNAHMVSAPTVLNAARTLAATVAKIKQHNHTLALVEEYLKKYKLRVDDITAGRVDRLVAEKLRRAEARTAKERLREQKVYENLIGEFELYRDEKESKVRQLEQEVAELRSTPEKHEFVPELTPESEPDHEAADGIANVSILSVSPPPSSLPDIPASKALSPKNSINLTLCIVAFLVGMAVQLVVRS